MKKTGSNRRSNSTSLMGKINSWSFVCIFMVAVEEGTDAFVSPNTNSLVLEMELDMVEEGGASTEYKSGGGGTNMASQDGTGAEGAAGMEGTRGDIPCWNDEWSGADGTDAGSVGGVV